MSEIKTMADLLTKTAGTVDVNDAEYYRIEAEKEKERLALRETAYQKSGINTAKFADAFTDNLWESDIKSKAKKSVNYMLSHNIGLTLLGNVGAGKSYCAAAVLHELMLSGKKGIYVEVSLLAREVEHGKSFQSKQSDLAIILKYASYDVLVIDEIGRVTSNRQGVEQDILFDIVNKRYGDGKTTILVSNLNYVDFGKYVGSAMMSRLTESSKFITFTGEDKRKPLPSWENMS